MCAQTGCAEVNHFCTYCTGFDVNVYISVQFPMHIYQNMVSRCLLQLNANLCMMLQVAPEAVDETVQVKGTYSIGKAEEM